MEYKIGDKVLIKENQTTENWNPQMDKWKGKVMTIRECSFRGWYKMIEDCDEQAGGGWFWYNEMFDGFAPEKEICISVFSNRIVGLLYENGECQNDVVYDRTLSECDITTLCSRAVYDLLKEKEQLYNSKVVCIKANNSRLGAVVGKVYEVIDGELHIDEIVYVHDLWGQKRGFKSIEDINHYFCNHDFLEIVE